MKIANLKAVFDPHGGEISVTPATSDDIWVLYNVIQAGDYVTCITTRKVSEIGLKTESFKVKLRVQAERVEYVGEDHEIHISGKVRNENRFAPMGSYHTLTLKTNLRIDIDKNGFDRYQQKLLKESLKGTSEINCAVLLIGKGISSLWTLGESSFDFMGNVNISIPKNRRIYSKHDVAVTKFFSQSLKLLATLNLTTLNTLVVSGPGFTKTEFRDWAIIECRKTNTDIGVIGKDLDQFFSKHPPLIVKSCTPTKASLDTLLQSSALQSVVSQSRLMNQIHAMSEFETTLTLTPDRVCYGMNSIEYAIDLGAVDHLIVSDRYYRSPNPDVRRRFSSIVETAMDAHSKVTIAYHGHTTYDTVSAMGGFAGILKFDIAEDHYPEEVPIEDDT